MQVELGKRIPMPDGVELAADLYLPDGPGPFPVVVTRTPYNKSGDTRHASRFTQRSMAYLVQDCRGKFWSNGRFHPFDEAEDGHATLDWIANQSWCNGRIGMFGASYLGYVQVAAAGGGHEALKCIAPACTPARLFSQWTRYDGCFALANTTRWAFDHTADRTRPPAHFSDWTDIWQTRERAPLLRKLGCNLPWLRHWIDHDCLDDYWAPLQSRNASYATIKTPALHRGGWFDHCGAFSTVEHYVKLRARAATDTARTGQRLLMFPTGHSKYGQSDYGDWDFTQTATQRLQSLEQSFFEMHLRDIDSGFSKQAPVQIFLMGRNRWLDLEDWPVPGTQKQRWYLDSDGTAGDTSAGGTLSLNEPCRADADTYVYDPDDPCPVCGGPHYWGLGLDNIGPRDQQPILGRNDVLLFRSAPLNKPLNVIGEGLLDAWLLTNVPDTDLVTKLCVEEPDNARITCLSVGSLRCRFRNGFSKPTPLAEDTPERVEVKLSPLAYTFPSGSRLAVLVTSSSFPRILPNPNTMEPTFSTAPAQKARNAILHEPAHASALVLPVVEDV